jgi:hypothetical protein
MVGQGKVDPPTTLVRLVAERAPERTGKKKRKG